MTSRLCTKCKTIHQKPWDKNCKGVTARVDSDSTENRDTDNTDSTERAVSKDNNEPQVDNVTLLINSVKELTSRVTAYDTKLDALTARIEQ